MELFYILNNDYEKKRAFWNIYWFLSFIRINGTADFRIYVRFQRTIDQGTVSFEYDIKIGTESIHGDFQK